MHSRADSESYLMERFLGKDGWTMEQVDRIPPYTGKLRNSTQSVEVRLVSTDDERRMVSAVRAAVYLGEEGGSYFDQFDANDHCSSALLAMVDGEPVGTVRIRWFAEFARVERLTIRKSYRSLAVVNLLVKAALKLAGSKGYKEGAGLARLDGVPIWKRQRGQIAGPEIATVYGPVVPMRCPVPPDQIATPMLGTAEAEMQIYGWEGVSLQ